MANMVFDNIEGDDNIIPLYSDTEWAYTTGIVYPRMSFFASLGLKCYENNRLIESDSTGNFRTTDYANELINEQILSFLFVFNHQETYIINEDMRAITNLEGGLTLSTPGGFGAENIDVAGTPINLTGTSIFSTKLTMKRGIVIRKTLNGGLGIILNGQNLSANNYTTQITGGAVGGLSMISRCNGYLIPQYL